MTQIYVGFRPDVTVGDRAAFVSDLASRGATGDVGLDIGDRGPVGDLVLVALTVVGTGALAKVGEDLTDLLSELLTRAMTWRRTRAAPTPGGVVELTVEEVALKITIDESTTEADLEELRTTMRRLDLQVRHRTLITRSSNSWQIRD